MVVVSAFVIVFFNVPLQAALFPSFVLILKSKLLRSIKLSKQGNQALPYTCGFAPKPTREQKDNSIMTNEEWNTYFNGHWYFSGAKQDKHLAMFPEELPHRLIKMFSFPNETVLDPFMGSGTTALAARKLNRNSIGYEINADFIPIIKNKIGQNDVLSSVSVEVVKQNNALQNFDERIKAFLSSFTYSSENWLPRCVLLHSLR